VLRSLGKLPGLESRLRRFAVARGLIGAAFDNTLNSSAHSPSMTAPQELRDLSPRAREIYFQLKVALEKKQENS
jgi:hypothetical protein